MTDFDPYLVLGLERTVAAGAVKAAYRMRVRTAHPDKGGDPDEFMAIVKAFDVLSDPDARRMFDETGVVDPQAATKLRSDVAVVLADMFDAAVRTAVDTGLPLESVDFIDMMTSAVRNNAEDARDQAERIESEMAALGGLRQRIRRHDEGTNMFAERLDEQITAKAESQAQLRRRVHVFEVAMVELGNYDTEVELLSALQSEATG
ncbi:DnaJ domain-containing protein [Devosia nitrariae]|uniref:Molecular chaperone DnaJ n=1 Tax=Devosia nitrariae TaxID=2071872 RepID=A0ABQ5W7K7_9HYPH|nr:DnaJ domain-containing protein [Devosia nitrariae]GLQ55769.1 molecular chaperone DnaJ [Devosia nitrariae]